MLPIELDDVAQYFSNAQPPNNTMLHNIERNTLYFIKLFAEAADQKMPEPSDPAYVNAHKDVYDVLIEQVAGRLCEAGPTHQPACTPTDPPHSVHVRQPSIRRWHSRMAWYVLHIAANLFWPLKQRVAQDMPLQGQPPPELQRRFEVTIHPRSTAAPRKMREIDARALGSLVTLRVGLPCRSERTIHGTRDTHLLCRAS